MTLKLLGAALVVFGCGGVGFTIAANYRKEERLLRQLMGVLEYMECELTYRLTPLPRLCKQAASTFGGAVGGVLTAFAAEMETQVSPDISICMQSALRKTKNMSPISRRMLEELSKNIGKFHLEGQLKGLESVREECRRQLELLTSNRDGRLRSYQTLGLCAGAALAILLI